MKKLISVLLCAAIIIGTLGTMAIAYEKEDVSPYPVVLVPGFSGAWLMNGDDPETAENAWAGADFSGLLPSVLDRILEIGTGLAVMNFDNAQMIGRIVAEEIEKNWPLMQCNPDGTSKYNVKPYYTDAADTNTKILEERDLGFCEYEREYNDVLCGIIGEENVYNFGVDWRMGSEYCATKLNEYIKSVKEYSGSEKVNVFAVSQGGQIASTYLALYGESMDVNNIVLSSPAIGGSALASDLLSRKVSIDEQTLMMLIEHGMYMEEDIEWLLRANELGFLDDIFNAMVPNVADSIGYWQSIWDFVPMQFYEDLKKEYLNKPENAPMVESSDRFHYEILPTIKEKFRLLQSQGMNINIITGSGDRMVSGLDVNSDGIIPTYSATGATCAPFGKRFSDGYNQVEEWDGKYKVSPDMTIDASTCYLPDNTWFSDHSYHAWSWFSDCTKDLALKLMITDEIKDVYSDPKYPQFLWADNLSKTISFNLVSSENGIMNGDVDSIKVRNVLEESDVKITAVYCNELKLKFDVGSGVKLAPGEEAVIPFEGDIPQTSKQCIHISVYYKADTITPFNYSTRGFTVMNGEAAEPLERSVDIPDPGILGNLRIPFASLLLKKLGLYELVSMALTVLYCRIINIF
ncbi:MAG: alpha/beta fold hydrolase [Clostridia bacterium]|nr:alpha/beta fold hydrolase [Clostridia bacterium]